MIHSFRNKIFLVLVGTVVLLTGATLVVMSVFIRDQIERKTTTDVLRASRIFSVQQSLRFRKLDDICSRLAESRRLAAALEEGDASVLAGVAQNEQEISKLGHTFVVITDKNGKTLFPRETTVERLVANTIMNKSERRTGFVVRRDQIFEALCKPMRTENDLLGYIVVAVPVDDATATELAQAFGYDTTLGFSEPQPAEVGFMVDGHILASTLRKSEQARVEAVVQKKSLGEFIKLEVNGSPYVAFSSQAGWGVDQVIMFSQQPLRDLLAALRFDAMLVGSLALLVCVVITSWLARGIAAPVSELEAGARKIRDGDLTVRVKPRTADEIGRLAEAFNEMATGLQWKEKYRGVLDKVVSPEVADELLSGKIELGGELRSVTVLFSDIRGFTPMTEQMKPREILEMLNEHMTAMTEIVRRHSGIVDKFVGDQVMAVFGAPKSSGADARAALRAAVEMRTKRREMNQYEFTKRQIELGFGLNTGEVVAGNMGSDKQLSYTVLGPTVNLAMRLCQAARPTQILATETTITAAGKDVVARALGPVKAKGFTDPIQVFDVGNVT